MYIEVLSNLSAEVMRFNVVIWSALRTMHHQTRAIQPINYSPYSVQVKSSMTSAEKRTLQFLIVFFFYLLPDPWVIDATETILNNKKRSPSNFRNLMFSLAKSFSMRLIDEHLSMKMGSKMWWWNDRNFVLIHKYCIWSDVQQNDRYRTQQNFVRIAFSYIKWKFHKSMYEYRINLALVHKIVQTTPNTHEICLCTLF